MSKIPDGITRAEVHAAVLALDRGEPHEFGDSTGYDLYRVFNFATSPKFFRLDGDLRQRLHLQARTYEARSA